MAVARGQLQGLRPQQEGTSAATPGLWCGLGWELGCHTAGGLGEKQPQAQKGLLALKGLGVSCKSVRAPRQSGGQAVLGRDKHEVSGSTSTRILANLPQF